MVNEGKADEIIERFKKVMGPVANTLAADAGREVGVVIIDGRVQRIESEEQYKKLVEKLREKFSRIMGPAITDSLITG
ncbi:MAG: hypothetical protein QXP42_05595 [Candidatus Micrarchaeia archaeon]